MYVGAVGFEIVTIGRSAIVTVLTIYRDGRPGGSGMLWSALAAVADLEGLLPVSEWIVPTLRRLGNRGRLKSLSWAVSEMERSERKK